MKTYTKFKQITIKEALQMLLDNNGDPIPGLRFTDSLKHHSRPITGALSGVGVSTSGYNFMRDNGDMWHYALQAVEICPREVPKDLSTLPEDQPWLAYVGRGPLPNHQVLECSSASNRHAMFDPVGCEWITDIVGTAEYHYAIDTSTRYAKDNFPEIVRAMEYDEDPQFEEFMRDHAAHLRKLYKKAWDAGRNSVK